VSAGAVAALVGPNGAGKTTPLEMIKRLSGGQQAQVSLTMALAKRAPLLVLDEPVASLDPARPGRRRRITLGGRRAR
jgi:ABC-type multidrug transport system ATPase subunit